MIKKLENLEEINGTCYHGDSVQTSFYKLSEIFGLPSISNENKVNYEWNLTYNNIPFSLYDWKYYRQFKVEEPIIWHIGAKTPEESKIVKKELDKIIN